MTKISDLSALAGASVTEADDLIPVVDMSEAGVARNKKMTFAELKTAIAPIPLSYLDTDDTLAADSDSKVPTQQAVKAYVDAEVAAVGGITFATGAEYRTGTETAKALSPDSVWDGADLVALNDSGGNIAVDLSTGINFSMTMDGDYTLSNPTNAKPGQSGCIVLTQDGTGDQTLAYGSNWKFAGGTDPVLSTAASAVDVLFYQVISSSVIVGNLVKAIA